MSILEITQLRLKGLTADDATLLERLSYVRDRLRTSSRFFCCVEDPSLIYIFGLWESLGAHLDFLASPECSEILKPQEEILSFQWTIHVELRDCISFLSDMSHMTIERIEVNTAHIDRYTKALDEHKQALQNTDSVHITYGWRCDTPIGSYQSVVIMGSNSNRRYSAEDCIASAVAGIDGCTGILLHHAWDIERAQSMDQAI
ncbi:hypothetical protein E8E13_010838 [Curvularia kusanoi]|uniref:Uncharacterized protein n=1 Tax=Curvularia kusanoi TaxID=90978 RepID=A0A9P4TKR4_CURKU|nr:hypothetical protein E8E13_010838 [Curvularia kusanoi]